MNTPWGQSDSVEMVADGIWDVGTPSHGGVKLSCKRQALLPANAKLHNFFKTLAWWEEDCGLVRSFLGVSGRVQGVLQDAGLGRFRCCRGYDRQEYGSSNGDSEKPSP
jgi:hypothetical protein